MGCLTATVTDGIDTPRSCKQISPKANGLTSTPVSTLICLVTRSPHLSLYKRQSRGQQQLGLFESNRDEEYEDYYDEDDDFEDPAEFFSQVVETYEAFPDLPSQTRLYESSLPPQPPKESVPSWSPVLVLSVDPSLVLFVLLCLVPSVC
ncbi:hypothetical protein DPEC_G00348630 [Dallia pectoralis]|uniref:Uncharacterized protein n=1 Tax=Dallia pectoralis TaxID=75939 RepID=A0ACC2F182_DALPE|nr:hypothetical protein DPEC_G00348630 [Dallia pectoralis]